MIQSLKQTNFQKVEHEINRLQDYDPQTVKKMFQYQSKVRLKNDLLEDNVRKEYKSGICDPQRIVAKVEKTKNKNLAADRLRTKLELAKAFEVVDKLIGSHGKS